MTTKQAKSRHLSPRQYRGLEKLGDACLPGDGELPRFSELGCAEHVDAVLDEMPKADLDSLKMLLAICGITPRWKLAMLLRWLEGAGSVPNWLGGGGLRFLRMGVKGLVLTLYYSGRKGAAFTGPTPLEVLEYRVGVYTGDLPA